jgi:putative hydrolase of the HAD superfamily
VDLRGLIGRRFDAAVFDLYGTLVPEFRGSDFADTIRGMARRLGAPADAFETLWDGTVVKRQTGGFPTVADNVVAICRELGVRASKRALEEALDLRRALYERLWRPREGAIETLMHIRGTGRPIALVSMCAPDTPALWSASEMAPLVDVTVFSSEVGLRKPDPGIYRHAADGLGVDPEQCLYCGDAPYELVGAKVVGMAAVQLRDGGHTPPLFLPDQVEHPAWSGPAIDDLRALVALFP